MAETEGCAPAAAELPPSLPADMPVARRASILSVVVDGHAPPLHTHVKKMGALSVAVVLFASVAGGPYGIESAVGIGGALPTLIGILVVSWCWSATQALMSAELATMYPSDGGFVTWVTKGLGPIAGYVNMCNSVGSSICNLPLYPALLVSYITNVFSISNTWVWVIKAATVILTVVSNVYGIEAVTHIAMVFTVIVMTPFVAMPIAAWAKGMPLDWHTASTNVAPNWTSNLSLFISTLCWNAQGWVNAGNISSEVKDPQKSYPRGALGAVVLTALNYVIPVFLCVAISPDTSAWGFGKFVAVAAKIGPWMMYWALLAAIVSSMNNYQPQLGMTARAIRFTALYNMVPFRWLKKLWVKHETPIGAILMQGTLSIVLMSVDQDVLMVLNNLLYNVGLALQFIAFMWLRRTAPHAPRPFKAPWPWFLTLSFFAIQGVSWYAAVVDSGPQLLIVVGLNVLFVAAGWAWKKWVYHDGLIDAIDAAEGQGEDATAVSDLMWAETPVPAAMAGLRATLFPCWARCRRPPNTSWMPLGMEPTRRASMAGSSTEADAGAAGGGVAALPLGSSASGLSLVTPPGLRGGKRVEAVSGGATPRADAPSSGRRGGAHASTSVGGSFLLGRRASSDGSSDDDRESAVSLLSSPYQAAVPDLRSLPVSSNGGSSAGTSSVASSGGSGGANSGSVSGSLFVLGGTSALQPAPSPILIAGGASPAQTQRSGFAFAPAGGAGSMTAALPGAAAAQPSPPPSSKKDAAVSSRYVLPTPESIASALRNKGEYIERERSFGGERRERSVGPDGRPRPPSRRSSSQTLASGAGVILRALSRGTSMALGGEGAGGAAADAEDGDGSGSGVVAAPEPVVEMELGGLGGDSENE